MQGAAGAGAASSRRHLRFRSVGLHGVQQGGNVLDELQVVGAHLSAAPDKTCDVCGEAARGRHDAALTWGSCCRAAARSPTLFDELENGNEGTAWTETVRVCLAK